MTLATFVWLDGHSESVDIYAIRDGRAYVSWPESRRVMPDGPCPTHSTPDTVCARCQLPGRPVERPSSWVDMARVQLDTHSEITAWGTE